MAVLEKIRDITAARMPVSGCPDVILTRDDFVSDRAWERLLLGYSLSIKDFVDIDNWKRYWILLYKLDEGVVVVSGPEGSGKSLWMYYVGFHLRELFGKSSTYDIPPKESYGDYKSIDDFSFNTELSKFKEIALMEKAVEKGDIPRSDLEEALSDVKLYNAFIGIDEAYDRLDKSRRGNFAMNMGRLIRKYRHFHLLIALVTPDSDDLDRRMAFKRRTHEVHCFTDSVKCRYNIHQRRADKWTCHELTPPNWSFLWETHNIIGSTVLPIKGEKIDKEEVIKEVE